MSIGDYDYMQSNYYCTCGKRKDTCDAKCDEPSSKELEALKRIHELEALLEKAEKNESAAMDERIACGKVVEKMETELTSIRQQLSKPIYAYRRKGLDYFCTCDEERYLEFSNKPYLFEVTVFYTYPTPLITQERPVAWMCNVYEYSDKIQPVIGPVQVIKVGIILDHDKSKAETRAHLYKNGLCRPYREEAIPLYSCSVLDILSDGYAVFNALDKKAETRTSMENVSDVLNAIVSLLHNTNPLKTMKELSNEN